MPRLFFNLHECGTLVENEEGTELGDLEAARQKALQAARAIMSDEVSKGQLCLSCRVEVVAADGTTVLTVPFRDAISITGL